MSDDTYNGHKYDRAILGLEIDRGARKEQPKSCVARLADGTLCMKDDGHAPPCVSAGPPHYDHPQRPVDYHLMSRPKQSAPPSTKVEAITWPSKGSQFRDSIGRVLTITETIPESPNDRHIVGTLDDGSAYACGRYVFDVVWTAAV